MRDEVTRLREQKFNCELMAKSPIPVYNPLQDRNLRTYFDRESVRRVLYDAHLTDKNGRIFDYVRSVAKLRIIEQEFELYDRVQQRLSEDERVRRKLLSDRRAAKRQHNLMVKRVKQYYLSHNALTSRGGAEGPVALTSDRRHSSSPVKPSAVSTSVQKPTTDSSLMPMQQQQRKFPRHLQALPEEVRQRAAAMAVTTGSTAEAVQASEASPAEVLPSEESQ